MDHAKNRDFKIVNTKEGNACYFNCFRVLNFCIFLSSLGMLGADIYLFIETKSNAFTWIFLALSHVLLVCSLLSFYMRKQVHRLGYYLWIILAIFIVQLLVTILLFVEKSRLIDRLVEASGLQGEQMEQLRTTLNNNIVSVNTAMVVFSVILVSATVYSRSESYVRN